VVSLSGREEIATAWYEAAKLKTAEQAAEAILPQLPTEPTFETGPSAVAIPVQVHFTSEPVIGLNPAAALNELTQAGLLQANGYELLDQSGPSHQPTFATVAGATIPDGRNEFPDGRPTSKVDNIRVVAPADAAKGTVFIAFQRLPGQPGSRASPPAGGRLPPDRRSPPRPGEQAAAVASHLARKMATLGGERNRLRLASDRHEEECANRGG
jgi:hypothetical protein